jgi:hypothetical protein
MKLMNTAYMLGLATMALYLVGLMAALSTVGKPRTSGAETSAFLLLGFDLLIALASIAWFAHKSAAASGSPRYGWVVVFGLWQLLILAVAGFISLVSLNQ